MSWTPQDIRRQLRLTGSRLQRAIARAGTAPIGGRNVTVQTSGYNSVISARGGRKGIPKLTKLAIVLYSEPADRTHPDVPRFNYMCVEAYINHDDGWPAMKGSVGGKKILCRNIQEAIVSGQEGIQAYGVDITDTPEAEITIKPIRTGQPVIIHKFRNRAYMPSLEGAEKVDWWFNGPLNIAVNCTNPERGGCGR